MIFIGCRAGSVTTERWRYPAPGRRDRPSRCRSRRDLGRLPDRAAASSATPGCRWRRSAPRRPARQRRSARSAVAARARRKIRGLRALAERRRAPIKPERAGRRAAAVLPDDVRRRAPIRARRAPISPPTTRARAGRHFISNRAHGALGYAMSAAMGARSAGPNAKVVAVMGDGSFGFPCGELETVVRLGSDADHLRRLLQRRLRLDQGRPEDRLRRALFLGRLQPHRPCRVAAAYGLKSWRVETPRQLKSVLAEAAKHDGPALVDIIAEPLQDANAPVSEWVA